MVVSHHVAVAPKIGVFGTKSTEMTGGYIW